MPVLDLITEPRWPAPPASYQLRAATTADHDAVHAFVTGLSPEAQYRRFFTLRNPVPRSLIQGLILQTGTRRNLIAVSGAEVIGHAMAAANAAGEVELAMVVADDSRRRGIATRLMWQLIDDACLDGATRFRFDVLSENYLMRDWLGRCFPEARYERDFGSVTVLVSLSTTAAFRAAA
jgi:GNAT superfamily N-acetyltransferase